MPDVTLLVLALALAGSVATGWVLGHFAKGRPAAGAAWGLAGPLGWVVLMAAYAGAIRCPSCGRRTPFHRASGGAGPTAAHLRCRHCRNIID